MTKYTFTLVREKQGLALWKRSDGMYSVTVISHKKNQVYSVMPTDVPKGSGTRMAPISDAGIQYVAKGYTAGHARAMFTNLLKWRDGTLGRMGTRSLDGPGEKKITWKSLPAVRDFFLRPFIGSFHVGTSDAEIEKKIRERMHKYGPSPALMKKIVSEGLKIHHANRSLYTKVQRGRF